MKPCAKLIAAIVLGFVCLLTKPTFSTAQVKVVTEEEAEHYKWLAERLNEVNSIKVCMTRADLLKVFEPDGGLERFLPEIYVLRSCSLIKVKVEFEFPKGMSRDDLAHGINLLGEASGKNFPINSQIEISAVSKPYLEPMKMD